MQSALFLNVVIRQCPAIFQLLAGKDEALLVRWDTLFVLDIINCIRSLHVECDGLACESLHEDLHTSSQAKYQMQSALFLNVVIRQCTAIFQLLAGKDEALLVRWDTLFVLDLCLHIVNCIGSLHVECDGLACESLYEDLHTSSQAKHQMQSALFLNVVIRQCPAPM